MSQHFKLGVFMGMTALVTIFSFQNCSPVSFQGNENYGVLDKVGANEDEQNAVNCTDCDAPRSQGQTVDGEVLIPAPESSSSMYVCPKGTESSSSASPAIASGLTSGSNHSFASGNSSGPGPTSVSTFATSDGTQNTAGVKQTGENNTGYIYQSGQNNTGNIEQNGSQNNACIVQVGDSNQAGITQTGDKNSAGVNQVGGQGATVTQNGPENSRQSAEECGCRVVDCGDKNSALDPICQQGAEQDVISKLTN